MTGSFSENIPARFLSASLAARLGLSVLVLPLASGAKVEVSRSGQLLDPEPNFVLGLGDAGLLAKCLEKLGIAETEKSQVQTQAIAPQMATPEHRLSLFGNPEALKNELEREFGRDETGTSGVLGALTHAQAAALDFWNKLPARLTLSPEEQQLRKDQKSKFSWAAIAQRLSARKNSPESLDELRRRLEKGLASKGRSPGLERLWFRRGARAQKLSDALSSPGWDGFCRSLWYGATGVEVENPGLPHLLHLLALSSSGAGFRGGLTAYREFLLKMAERHGAHIPEKSDCRRIFIEEGRFVGVQMANRGTMIQATGGIIGCSLAHVKDQLTEGAPAKWSKSKTLRASPKPYGWRFTMALTVHAEAIPPGLAKRLVWQEPGAPVLEFEVVNPAEYGIQAPEHRYIFARTLMPFTEESLSSDHQRKVAARMLRQMTELLPFLEFHVVRVYPEFRHQNDELKQAYPFTSVDAIPENLRCIRGRGVGSRSGLEGLFVATGESYPELGSMGPTAASLEAVSWIAHRRGLAGPLLDL